MAIDYSKLSAVGTPVQEPARKVVDSKGTGKRPSKSQVPGRTPKVGTPVSKVSDSKKAAIRRVLDAKRNFRVTDSYKNLRNRIQDAFADTTTTDEAVAAAVGELGQAAAEQVVTAVVEVLGGVIDILQEGNAPIDEPAFDEPLPEAPIDEAPIEEPTIDDVPIEEVGGTPVEDSEIAEEPVEEEITEEETAEEPVGDSVDPNDYIVRAYKQFCKDSGCKSELSDEEVIRKFKQLTGVDEVADSKVKTKKAKTGKGC